MNKNVIIAVAIGLVVGIGGTVGVVALTKNGDTANTDSTQLATVIDHSTMSMADMNEQLEGLSGDEFDKAFIEMMIAHHEGAVDMAELIPSRANHSEIKTLGEAIITAQTKEIADMKQWQKDWGYSTDEMMNIMHGSH